MSQEIARAPRSGAEELFETIIAAGWVGLEQWKTGRHAEEYLLEFKGAGREAPRLERFDKANIGKAVSGFANASGGVLVIGIETKTQEGVDRIKRLAHAPSVEAYAGAINAHLAQCTDPRVPGARAQAIVKPNTDTGVVLVPSSDGGPHRAKVARGRDGEGDHTDKYFHRQGTQTLVLEHPLLAAMFGRTPPPKLLLRTRIEAGSVIGFWLRNIGRGAARDILVRISVIAVDNLVESDARISHLEVQSVGEWAMHWARHIEQNIQKFTMTTTGILYPGDEICVGILDAKGNKYLRIVGRIDADGMQPVSISQPYDAGQRGALDDDGRHPHIDLFLREEEE